MTKKIAIYGAGGFGREVAWLLESYEARGEYEVIGFLDDSPNREEYIYDKPVYDFETFCEQQPDSLITIAIGSPRIRKILVEKCEKAGFSFPVLEHPSVQRSRTTSVGEGSIICANSSLTADSMIGKHVQINPGCMVAHDVRIGDYTLLTPGVNVAGNVHIGEGVYLGLGAMIINGTPSEPLIIPDGCVIGAGACVIASIEEPGVYVGVPARRKKSLA